MRLKISWLLGFFLLIISSLGHSQTPDNVLIVGQVAEPKSLDPQAVTAVNDFRILMNIYDGLVRYKNGSLEVEPGLAKSWTINDSGTEYRFQLRENIHFHDGSEFNAEAVKFNFDRMLDETHPFHDTGPFPLAFFFSAIEETRVIDKHTVSFILDKPYAPLLSNLAYPTGLIASPTAIKKHKKDFGRHPSGTGPFQFAQWESNRLVAIEKNPQYWDGVPKLDALVFRPITDANTRVTELLSGGIDIMVEVPPDNVKPLQQDQQFNIHEQAGPHLWFLILNMKEGPFTDKRVRQAVNYAINKPALVKDVLQDTATVATGPTPAAFSWAYNTDLSPYPYNPDKARQLIKDAGASGKTLTFYVTEGGSGMLNPIAMATAIQADLKAVGLKVNIETYEWNTFLGKVNPGLAGKADMAEMAWMTNDPDTLPFLALRSEAWPENGGFNSGYYANKKVDQLLEQARASTSQQQRAKLYREMQAIVYEDAPWAFIANWKQNAASTSRVKNLHLQPSFLLLLKDVYKQ